MLVLLALGVLLAAAAIVVAIVAAVKHASSRSALGAEEERFALPNRRGKGGAIPDVCVQIAGVRLNEHLVVNIYHHALPPSPEPIACWTYVSQGLRARGQKEIVCSVACRKGEPVDAFPRDLLEMYAVIDDFACKGQLVDVGGRSEIGDGGPGILGNAAFRGMLYTPPQLGNFPAPDSPFLTAVALTRGELHLAMEQGMVRMMALLGHHYRFYPTPPWIDRDRKEIAHVEGMRTSILDKVTRAYATDLTVCEEVTVPRRIEREQPEVGLTQLARAPSRIHLRVGTKAAIALRELLAQPQAEGGFALLTGLEPTADACYIWKPGQTEPTAIGPTGRMGSRACGNFLILVPGQDKCEGRLLEDGFGVGLTDAAWADFRAAIAARAPLSIPGEGDAMGFDLSWPEGENDLPTSYGGGGPHDA